MITLTDLFIIIIIIIILALLQFDPALSKKFSFPPIIIKNTCYQRLVHSSRSIMQHDKGL